MRDRGQRNGADPRRCLIFLDANALNPVDEQRAAEVEEFNRLRRLLTLSIIKPHGVEREISHSNTPTRVRHQMNGLYTIPASLTQNEEWTKQELRRIMTGNASPDKHIADGDHLFEAQKYGARYFVTNDRRILKKEREINRLAPDIEIVTLAEMIATLHAWAGRPDMRRP